MDLLEAWKRLLASLQEEVVYTDYAASLERALAVTLAIATSAAESSSSSADHHQLLRCIRTLLDLLTQSVREHARDQSIECRFVTLLEVLLSYEGPYWEPSPEVAAFWVRLLQRIPATIAPVNFRRKAYRVLVSLSWVPSSKGLLEACSFEASKQVSMQMFDQCRPVFIAQHMGRIARGSGPLPRHDSVNQLLDRLKDETDVCVAITSEQMGTGKTTLAGQVATHPSILRVFTVLWLNIVDDEEPLTYVLYIRYLDELCRQIEATSELPLSWPTNVKRFEEPALRRLRERDCMKQAKELMASLIRAHDKNVLLVLDNVRNPAILEWFRFDDPRQSVIVTTPDPNITLDSDWTLELVPMSEEEAVELFLLEAGLPTTHILGCTRELRSMIQRCDCNPLTVRTIARWFQLKNVTAGMIASIEEIMEELDSLSASADELGDSANDPNMMLFDILSLMMGPARTDSDAPSSLFVLCFAAYVVVFPDAAPLDAVLLLWEQILKMEPLAIEELGEHCPRENLTRQAWTIAEGLMHMGLLSVMEKDEGTPFVDVHHELYREFAVLMAREMELKETVQETIADWHMAFVTGYLSRKSHGDKEKQDGSWKYKMEKLPTHMFEGKMASTAEIVLADESFFRARIEALGWKRGIEIQVEDCVALQHEVEAESEMNGTEAKVSTVFCRSAELLQQCLTERTDLSEDEKVQEEAQSLFLLGFSLAETGYIEEALLHLENAEKLSTSSRDLQASILYATGWCLLEANRTDSAKDKINASRKMMEKEANQHGLYKEMLRLFAHALIGTCDYKEAAACFKEALDTMYEDSEVNRIELGATCYMQGRLFYMMGETRMAREALEECVRWKVDNGEISRSLSAAQGILGDVNIELRRISEAKEHYEAALQTLDALDCDEQHLDYRLVHGKLQLLRNDVSGCKQSFDLVRKTIQEVPLTSMLDQSAYDLRHIARAFEMLGEYETTVKVLRESILLTQDRPSSLERAWGMIALGDCLVKRGEDQEALSCYEQALSIQFAKLGEGREVIDTTNMAGSVHLSLKEYDQALHLFTENLDRAKQAIPNDKERIAGIQYLLGEAYDSLGKFDSAAEYFSQCMETLKQDRGKDHLDIAKTLHRLGDVAASQKDTDKAFDFYSQALNIRRMHFDERIIADTLHCVGVLCRKSNDLELAREALLEALEIRNRLKSHYESCETMLEIANCYRLDSQYDKATEILAEGLAMFQDQEEDLRGLVRLAMGHVKLSQGDYAGASNEFEVARRQLLALHGKDDLQAGSAALRLGLVHFLMGQCYEALIHLEDWGRVCEQAGAGSSLSTFDFACSQLLLGDIFEFRGETDRARDSWIRAKEVNDSLKEEYLARSRSLLSMLNRRLEDTDSMDGKGFLSRFFEESGQQDDLATSEREDEEVLVRNLLCFVDDTN